MNIPGTTPALTTDLRLHVERMPGSSPRFTERRISDHEALGSLFTPYRATSRAVERPLGDPFARPMRVRDVVARLNEFPEANRKAFAAAAAALENESHISLAVPAYALHGGEYLLLDGNHRLCALWSRKLPFTLMLKVLLGPVDRRILIDLKHWDGGWRRFINRTRQETSADKARPAHHSP